VSADDEIFWGCVAVEDEQVCAVAHHTGEGDEFLDVLNHVLHVVAVTELTLELVGDVALVAEDDGEVHVDKVIGQACDVDTGVDVHDAFDVHGLLV